MSDIKQLIRELAKHAHTKKGAEHASNVIVPDIFDYPHVTLPVLWGNYFEVDQEDGRHFAKIPVFSQRLQEHQQQYPVIEKTLWKERDGHIQMKVPLNAGLPVEFLKLLIDEAHAIVWNKLSAAARLQIELADLPYDEPKLFDRLIEIHNLQEHRTVLAKIARPGILLLTRKSSEVKIPLGATKIGGRPDLPAMIEWPVYRNGKPLSFLAQFDLEEIATHGSPVPGLPSTGLLSVFSVWGWMDEDEGDPQIPDDRTHHIQEENGWTVLLHTPPQTVLERRKTPRNVNSFKAAVVELQPILSLPNHRHEPPLAALKLTADEYERFDEMQSDFRSLQMKHWLHSSDSLTSHHLLGGYALFQQQFPEEVLSKGIAMFLQIGTDGKTGMCWGDGGELTFYGNFKAMKSGRLDQVWGTCQGG